MNKNILELKVDNKDKNFEKYLRPQWSWKTLIFIVLFSFALVFVVKDLEIDFIKLVSDSSKVAIFLGSSLIWGTGVNDSSTIPSFFSLLSLGKYNSLNFGESEYSPYQSLLMLKRKLNENYNPNLVISYDGPNMLFSLIKGNNINSHSRENQIRNIINKYYEYDNTKVFTFYDFIKKIELF